GDGFDDIVFREAYSDEAFVLFGKAQRPAKLTLSHVGEPGRFSLRGLGRIVPSGAGDLNADGFSDISVALPDKQETYVIFGNSKPYQQSSLDFRDLDGANG